MSEQYEPKIGDLVKHKTSSKYETPLLIVDIGSKFIMAETYKDGIPRVVIFDKQNAVLFVEGS